MARVEGGQARGRERAEAPLYVEEDLAVHRRQLQDDVVRRDGQECPSRRTTSFRKKCSAREGLAVDHMHALEVLTGLRARSLGGSP